MAIASISPGVVLYSLIPEATLENVPSPTIVRTHLELIFSDDESVSTADSFGIAGYGVGLMERNAVAAGIASIPTPTADTDWDGWFVHGYANIGNATSGTHDSPLSVQRVHVDSKAMRKVGQDMVVVLVIEFTTVKATTALNFFGGFRILLKK